MSGETPFSVELPCGCWAKDADSAVDIGRCRAHYAYEAAFEDAKEQVQQHMRNRRLNEGGKR